MKKYGIGIGNDAAVGCWQAMYDATSAGEADTTASVSDDDPPALIEALDGILTPQGWKKYRDDESVTLDREACQIIFRAGEASAHAVPKHPVSQAVEQPADDAEDARAIQFALELAEHENDDAAISFLKAWNNEDAGYLRSNWPDFDAAMSTTKQEDDK